MKKNITIFLLLLLAQFAFSQVQPKADSIRSEAQSKLDSLVTNLWQKKLDSLHSLGNLEKYKDSLKVIGWADSLKQRVNTTFTGIQNSLQSKIDSLLVRNQPTLPFQRKIDSLQSKQQALLSEVSAKQNQLQQKVNERYKKWGSKLDSLGQKLPNQSIPGIDKVNGQLGGLTTKLPNAQAQLPNNNFAKPSLNLPNTPMPSTTIPSASIPSLSTSDFANLNLSKDLNNVGGKLSVPGTDQMKQWNDQLKNVANPLKDATGKLNEAKGALKDPGKAAEEAANQLKDVNATHLAQVFRMRESKRETCAPVSLKPICKKAFHQRN
ncbi:MAG: hypothetical protein KA713_03415 [Chryseotalea sp. WA131a]|nr:MAG: hypothetical protein KA713_03415 [Chryseotalea sp. WA131a]